MSEKKEQDHEVTMRVKIGSVEMEVTGPISFVEKQIDDFIKKHEARSELWTNTARPLASGSIEGTLKDVKPISVAQFFRKLGAKTDIDRALGAGYYLEKYRQFEKFSAAEVKETIREAKIPPPKNPNDAVNKNIKKGFIMAAGDKDGKMGYVLTSDGEAEVVNALAESE
jgi:hypothetical protein